MRLLGNAAGAPHVDQLTTACGEALEMGVAYVRGWSIGLDLSLLMRTPFALLRQRNSTR